MMKTYSAKPVDVQRQWLIVDAAGITLGRLATIVASRLMGKHKPGYTSHIDVGDHIIVINAGQVKLTGNKIAQKKYYRHSGYPGGIKEVSLEELMQTAPQKVIEHAVKGMLPKNKLQDPRLKRLRAYATAEHPHAGQEPVELKIEGAL